MEDIYAALMGDPITEEEKMKALARKLATQRGIGRTGQILGGRLLAPAAADTVQATDEATNKLAGLQARRRELVAQEKMARMNDEDRARQAELDRAHDLDMLAREQAFRASENARDRALTRATAELKGGKSYSLPASLENKLLDEASEVTGLSGVASGFKPEFAGLGIPGARGALNYAAAKGLGTEGMKEAQKWWAEWDRAYTLPTRNRMFGSALTAPERKAWNEANITKDMTPEQIQKNLKTIEDLRVKALSRKRDFYLRKGMDPDIADAMFGEGGAADSGAEITSGGEVRPSGRTKYYVGQVIEHNGAKYRVTGGDLNNDPDVEEVP